LGFVRGWRNSYIAVSFRAQTGIAEILAEAQNISNLKFLKTNRMPDLFYLISKWWKQMFFVVFFSLLIVGIITFMKPRQYLSVATALPASSILTDKGSIFNENLEYLYSALGSSDDVDRIVGTAQLDTIYLAVTDQFNLYDHYKISESSKQRREKAAQFLKKRSKVYKSSYGELKIKVWDTDKNLAPQLANAILGELQSIYQELQNSNNKSILNTLRSARQKIISRPDSLSTQSPGNNPKPNQQMLSDQLVKYEKLINEYQFIIDNKPAALIVVEKATPAIKPDKPKRLNIMVATLFASFIFSILLALLLERKNLNKL
jgi:capsular polysaccharide biosynthesis protein